MDDIDAGAIAAKLADFVRDGSVSELYADTSHVVEGGRLARFTFRLPNGQEFALQLEEL
jgi:hypothetical protein